MKGKIIKLISIEYDSEEEKKRTEEAFNMFASIEGAKVKDIKCKKSKKSL